MLYIRKYIITHFLKKYCNELCKAIPTLPFFFIFRIGYIFYLLSLDTLRRGVDFNLFCDPLLSVLKLLLFYFNSNLFI